MASTGEQTPRVSTWHQHAALPVLLQHASINSNVKLVCLLLQVSKDTRSTLTAHCRGLLNVNRALQTEEQADSMFGWLAAHGMLLKKLEWSAHPLLQIFLEHHAQVGAAFQRALAAEASRLNLAAGQCRLLLQDYNCSDPTSEGTAILRSLSPQHLTKLQLHLKPDYHQRDYSDSVQALAQLTSLQDLTLNGQGAISMQHVNGLRQLANLTRLLLGSFKHSKPLNCIPAQLKELTIAQPDNLFSQERTDPGWLSLGHLTALTKMLLPRDWTVYSGDILPGNLEVLEVGDSTCADPLLHLQRLKTLSLLRSTLDASETDRLSVGLGRLECVHLKYSMASGAAAAAAAAWSSLPIVGLKLMHQDLTRDVFGELAKLTGLTELHIMHQQRILDFPSNLALALTGLSRLARLAFACINPGNSFDEYTLELGTIHLCHSLCKLPQLSDLQLGGVPCMDSVATMLSAATQLTHLQLNFCELSDYSVNSVVCGLSRLRSFCLTQQQQISPAVLPVIVAALPQLTELQLLGPQCIIKDWTVEQLSKLSHSRELCIQGVSDAAIQKALRRDT